MGRRLFGDVMSAVDGLIAHVVGPACTGVRIVDRPPVVLIGLGPHMLGGGGVPGLRIRADELLGGLGRLAEEEQWNQLALVRCRN